MKNNIQFYGIKKYPSGIIFFLTIIFLSFKLNAEEVHLLVDEWQPFIEKQDENLGFSTAVVTKAFEKIGIKAKIKFVPWARVTLYLDEGRDVLSFYWIKSEERMEKWFYSESFFTAQNVLFKRKNSDFSWVKIKDSKIGISRGNSYGIKFDSIKDQLKLQYVENDEQNIGKLAENRIDAFPGNYLVISYLLKNKFQSQKDMIDVLEDSLLGEDTVHVVCSKKYDKCSYLLNKFNEGLELIKKDGTIQNIEEQYKSKLEIKKLKF
ncbi:MAG: transporter substrate-binding domain-containing protein [Desulfamplus sp.]|nr:transporter substrate-binding domain-containing protein [Desulfamplus sp.]